VSDVAGRANRAREALEEQGGLDPLIEEDDDEGLWGGPRNGGGHSGRRQQHDFIDELDDDLDEDEQFDDAGETDEPDDYGTVGDDY
jgi:hypothetical protein